MLVDQIQYRAGRGWNTLNAPQVASDAQLVLVFGDRNLLARGEYLESLRTRYPAAQIVSCSSGGDVFGTEVIDDGLVGTAIRFDRVTIHTAAAALGSAADSERAGDALGAQLVGDGLRHVLVFAEGLQINGSAFAQGLARRLPRDVKVTGGLAADGQNFERTLVGLNVVPEAGSAVAVGLYGNGLEIATGSFGGWEPFGPDRRITRSSGNVLHELDGRPALTLYKELLGHLGYALPASGLLFPLEIRESAGQDSVVRTILGVDEANQTVTFAGDIPQGWSARLVKTELDQLIRAAGVAAQRMTPVRSSARVGASQLVLVVSCIGRRLLLQRRVTEELDIIRRSLGDHVQFAGFYSYGEIAPSARFEACSLHNQTMTLTSISEA